MTTTYGVRAARSPALTGAVKPVAEHPLSITTISCPTSSRELNGSNAAANWSD